MKTIKNLKVKVMRTAWHLFRNTELNFSEALKKSWEIIKKAFERTDLQIRMCFLENGKTWTDLVDRPLSEINKDITKLIVHLVECSITNLRLTKEKTEIERINAEIRANNNAIVADSIIGGYKLD